MERQNDRYRIRNLLCSFLLMTGLTTTSTMGQQEMRIIPFVGYSFGVPHAIQREPGSVNLERFQTEGLGYSTNHTFRFGLGLAPAKLRLGPLQASFQLLLSSSNGLFISDAYDNGTGTIDTATTPEIPVATRNEFEVRVTESQVRLEALMNWEGPMGVEIGLGPWLGYRVSSSISQHERVLATATAVFATNRSTERVVAAGNPITSYPIRFGGLVAFGRSVPIGNMLRLRPEVFMEFDNESLFAKGLGLRAFSVGLNLGVQIDLTSKAPIPLEESRETPAPPSPSLTASIDLYNIDAPAKPDEAVISSKATLYTSYLPLLPTIRFAQNETDIHRALTTLTSDETQDFTENQSVEQGMRFVESNLLNIVGARMRESGRGEITFVGIAGDGESKEVAHTRVDLLRRYLTEVWRLDSTRLHIGEIMKGSAGSVRIESIDPILLAPVVQRWSSEEYAGPSIGLRKEIRPYVAVERWEIALRLDDSTIARYSSDGKTGLRETVELSFAELKHRGGEIALNADLTVLDRTGATILATDRLHLVRMADGSAVNEIRTWTFLPPTMDASIEEVNAAFLRSIAATLHNGAKVTIESKRLNSAGAWSRERIGQELLALLAEKNVVPGEIIIREADGSQSFPADRIIVRSERKATDR